MSNLITLSADETIASRPVGSNLDIVTKSDGTKFGACNMVSFIPLSYINYTITRFYAHAVAQYLAVKHLNTNDGSIVKELTGLNETCNIKFGLEFIDTEYDPTVAGNRALQRLSLENNTINQQESFDFGPCTFLESTDGNSVAEKTSYITGLKGKHFCDNHIGLTNYYTIANAHCCISPDLAILRIIHVLALTGGYYRLNRIYGSFRHRDTGITGYSIIISEICADNAYRRRYG